MLDKFIDWLDNFFDQLLCEHDWELAYESYDSKGKIQYHYICLDCGKKRISSFRL